MEVRMCRIAWRGRRIGAVTDYVVHVVRATRRVRDDVANR